MAKIPHSARYPESDSNNNRGTNGQQNFELINNNDNNNNLENPRRTPTYGDGRITEVMKD